MQHVDLSVALVIALFSQEKRWNRPDVLQCSWPLYFHSTVATLKIVLARGSCDIFPTQRLAFDRSSGNIVLPQRLVLARGFDDIVLELFLCSSDDRFFNLSSRLWRYSARQLALALR